MPNVDCPICKTLTPRAEPGALPLGCPACGAARKSPFDGLPVWPGTINAILPGARQNMMAGDDDDDDEGDDDDEDEKPSARKKGKDDDEEADDDKPKKKKGGMGAGMIIGIVAVLLLCCICVPGGIVGALLGPGLGKVREAAARTQSTNNLKQIGLAFQSFHDANKRLPFNGSNQGGVGNAKYSATAIANDPLSGSWAFQILPYIDQNPMFGAVDKTRGVQIFLCPGRSRPPMETNGGAWSDYFINGYLNDPTLASKPDAPDFKRTLVGITDGTSNTIMVGHGNIAIGDYTKNANVTGSSNIFVGGTIGTLRSGNNGQANPGGVTLSKDSAIPPGMGSWGGPFSQVALMAMGDGTVRMFPYTTPNFSAFLTPTGNEVTILPD